MSELRHPNVVQIYDFNTTPDGRPYFVMEHLEGRDLEARLTQAGPMPLPAAVRVVDAVASALATAHAHGIVHRDLKPANIFLVTIDGQIDELVKVLDFGISKIRSAGTLLSSPTDMIGSPAYMSPEQARGASDEIDGRSDQFALGAITYRMLTGFEPFQGDDIASLLYQVVHEEAPPLARTLPAWWDTRALQAVLDRALAKDPAPALQRHDGDGARLRGGVGADALARDGRPGDRQSGRDVDRRAPAAAAAPRAHAGGGRPRPIGVRAERDRGVRPAHPDAGAGADGAPDRQPPASARRPRRPRPAHDFSVDDGATVPHGSLPRSSRPGTSRTCATSSRSRTSGGARGPRAAGGRRPSWASPASTVTSSRAARRALGLAHPVPAQSRRRRRSTRRHRSKPRRGPAPPRRRRRRPRRRRPERPRRGQAGAGRARPPRASRPSRPAPRRARRRAAHSHHHHMSTNSRGSSTDRGASISPPGPRRRSTTSSIRRAVRRLAVQRRAAQRRAAPSARPNPFVQPPSGPPPSTAPPPDPLQNQFAIPPPAPTEDSPSRDLVAAARARARRPARPSIHRRRRATSPPPARRRPRTRTPADQPMAPSF